MKNARAVLFVFERTCNGIGDASPDRTSIGLILHIEVPAKEYRDD